MNKFSSAYIANGEVAEPGTDRHSSSPMYSRPSVVEENNRLAELENENSRLHRLVAELLLKNQQLRRAT
jgi:hypothetical protein